ncbi:MAG: WG repeat-containing protein [Pyrinomonadaceae bacterium]
MFYLIRTILLGFCMTVLSVPFLAQASDGSDLFVVIVNDKRGYVDRTGKIVVEPKWGGANEFSEGLAIVATYEGGYKQGYIAPSGRVVIEPQYTMAQNFSEGLAAVGFGQFGLHNGGDHRTGFIDKSGKLVIEPKYRDASSFSEGLSLVYDEGKYGFIDKSGKVIVPLQFEDALSFSNGLARVKVGDKFGFIDRSGKLVISPKFSYAEPFSEGLAKVIVGGPKTSRTYGGYFAQRGKGQIQFIDVQGTVIVKLPQNIIDAKSFSEGLAAIELKAKGKDDPPLTGFIDRSGRFVIPPKYPFVDSFKDGLAQFLLDGKWTFMDKSGSIIFSTSYQVSYGFERGLAHAQQVGPGGYDDWQNHKYGYIDKMGKVIWAPTK